MPSVRVELSHGAVGEIADVNSCAHDLLNTLFPDKAAEEWKDAVKKITTQAKRLRSQQKSKLGEYLVKYVTMSSENIETEGRVTTCYTTQCRATRCWESKMRHCKRRYSQTSL